MPKIGPEAFFRCLLIVAFLGAAAGHLVSIFPGDINEEWHAITEWNGNGGYYDYLIDNIPPQSTLAQVALMSLLVALLLIVLGVYVGLFFFWRFSRVANLLLTIAFILVMPWAGLAVYLPLQATMYDFFGKEPRYAFTEYHSEGFDKHRSNDRGSPRGGWR